MQIRGKLVRLAVTLTLGAGLTWMSPVEAQDPSKTVVLKSFDGFTQLRGELIEFDGAKFTIQTSLGVIQIDALRVNCEGEACPQNLLFGAKFGIAGSSSIGSTLMPALIEGYADSLDAELIREVGSSPNDRVLRIRHQNGQEMAEIAVGSEGTGTAFAALTQGAADIGMASRQARRRDVAAFVQAGYPDPRESELEHLLAIDALIAVVHPSNPVNNISFEELSLIFSGAVSNWSQLGGPDLPITLYARDEGSGTFQTFNDLVMAPTGALLTGAAKRLETNAGVADAVAGDAGGIGITAMAQQRATKALAIRQECGLLSEPNSFSVKTEQYPLVRRLYLYSKPEGMAAHARQIVDFAMSDEAQSLIADSGFINRSVETVSINAQGARLVHALTAEEEFSPSLMREMLLELRDAERLSITFRFSPGSSNLTPKSLADAQQFARDLAGGAYDDRDVLLVGFTDSIGQFELNRTLALRRAEVVNTTIRGAVAQGALDNVSMSTRGYGELTPVGCNTTFAGRFVNRRVEVWVRPRR